eukprot:8344725-Pyramimonas_sp.AAC.1
MPPRRYKNPRRPKAALIRLKTAPRRPQVGPTSFRRLITSDIAMHPLPESSVQQPLGLIINASMIAQDTALDLPQEQDLDDDIALDVARPLVLVLNNHGAWREYYGDPTDVDDGPYKGDVFAVALVAYRFVQNLEDVGSELAPQAMKMTKGLVTGFVVYEIIQMIGIDEHTLDIRTHRSDIHRSMMGLECISSDKVQKVVDQWT